MLSQRLAEGSTDARVFDAYRQFCVSVRISVQSTLAALPARSEVRQSLAREEVVLGGLGSTFDWCPWDCLLQLLDIAYECLRVSTRISRLTNHAR